VGLLLDELLDRSVPGVHSSAGSPRTPGAFKTSSSYMNGPMAENVKGFAMPRPVIFGPASGREASGVDLHLGTDGLPPSSIRT
jgi:hypothetical protein